jgi:hypothetical protein
MSSGLSARLPDMDADVAAARHIVDSIRFLTLATADDNGRPWVSPVWFAARGYREFIWASKPGARHSRNIGVRPAVSFVIFDSTVRPGAAEAVYVAATAEQVPDADLASALAAYSEASIRQGLPVWTGSDVRGPARHRLYRAIATETFVLTSTDERRAIDITDAAT